MSEYAYISKDESYALKHYGVLGMKWGVRKRPARAISLEGRARRVSAKNYGINYGYYSKKAARKAKKRNRLQTMAGMNRRAKEMTLRKAEQSRGIGKIARKAYAKTFDINQNYYTRKANKVDRSVQRLNTMANLNKSAMNEQLRKANEADLRKKKKR